MPVWSFGCRSRFRGEMLLSFFDCLVPRNKRVDMRNLHDRQNTLRNSCQTEFIAAVLTGCKGSENRPKAGRIDVWYLSEVNNEASMLLLANFALELKERVES